MSTLTSRNVAEKALRRASVPAEEWAFPLLNPLVTDGLARIGDAVWRSEDFRELQKEYTGITITAGVADPVTTAPAIILESLPTRGTVLVGGLPARPVPHYSTLLVGVETLLPDVYFYAIRDRKLHFRDLQGAVGALTNTATIWCNRIPTLLELPARYETPLVEDVAQMITQKVEREGLAWILEPEPPTLKVQQ